MWVYLVCILLVTWMLTVKWRRRRFDKLYDQLKISAWSLPFIGHSYLFLRNKEGQMKIIQELGKEAMNQGGISGLWLANKLYVVIADPKVAEIVLKNYLEKDDVVKVTHIGLGNGSIFACVKKWRPRRKLMSHIFNLKNLNQLVEIFSEQSIILAEKFQKVSSITIEKMLYSYTMDAICGALGIQVDAQQNSDQVFLVVMMQWFDILTTRAFKPWLHSDRVFKLTSHYQKLMKGKPLIYGFIDKIVQEKRKLIDDNNFIDSNKGDIVKIWNWNVIFLPTLILLNGTDLPKYRLKPFIELMLETEGVDDVMIQEETLVLMAAAVDTTAVGIGFALLMMARHPDVQDRTYQELKNIFGDSNRPVEAVDLHHLKYLEAVIKETLRLYPVAPIIARKIDQDLELPSGVTLVAGCGSVISLWAILRHPAYWGADAELFRPERFLDHNTLPNYPAAFIAFSHGPRNCLGHQYAMMSMKTVLATLLRRYRIVPASDELRDKPLRVKFDAIMRHIDGYRVGVEARE